jgi:hypothetical protein
MTVILAHLICIASALPNAASLEKAISELESAITPLENSSGWWEKSLPWFTGLVVIGLIADLVIIVLERRGDMAHWRRWTSVGMYFSDRPSRVIFLVELFATSAIFLGVAGELWAGSEIAYINGQLRTKNGELRNKSDQLVEAEHSALVKLEAKVAWRRLTKEQQSAIADHLKQFPNMRVGVSYLGGTPEASQFADDILATLHAAHWNAYRLQPFSLFGGFGGGVYPLHPSTGVNISTAGKKGRDAREAIQNELCSIGFDAAITPKPFADPRDPKIDVEVLVVGRPITPQGAIKLTINAKKKACVSTE